MIPDDASALGCSARQRRSIDWRSRIGGDTDTDSHQGPRRSPVKEATSSVTARCRPFTCQPTTFKAIRRSRCRSGLSMKRLYRKQLRGPKKELSRGQRLDPGKSRDSGIGSDDAVVPRCYWKEIEEENRLTLTSMSGASVSDIVNDRRRRPPPRHHQPGPAAAAPTPNGAKSTPMQPSLVGPAVSGPGTRLSTESVEPTRRLLSIPVPIDPRQWSRLDVRVYLDHARHLYEIHDLDLDRFPMNGKGLCVLSEEMFQFRVPCGGTSLYLDFQWRFRRALELIRTFRLET